MRMRRTFGFVAALLVAAALAGCQGARRDTEIAKPAPAQRSATVSAAMQDAKRHHQQRTQPPGNFQTHCHPVNGDLHCQTTSN